MEIIEKDDLRVLTAEEGKHIRSISDVYISESVDEETGEKIEEHFPYYTDKIYLGSNVKDEDIDSLYIEEDIPEEVEQQVEE